MFSSQQFLTDAAMARITEIRVTDPEYSLARRPGSHPPRTPRPCGQAQHPRRGPPRAPRHQGRRQPHRHGRPPRLPRPHPPRPLRRVHRRPHGHHGHPRGSLHPRRSASAKPAAPSLLDGKVLIGSLNRGGLAGSAWELDDPITGPTPATCADWRLDGAKAPAPHRRQ